MDDRNAGWFARRTSQWQDWPAERLLAAKQQLGVMISVVGSVAHSLIATVPLGRAVPVSRPIPVTKRPPAATVRAQRAAP